MAYDNMQELERLTNLYLEGGTTLEEETLFRELLTSLPDSALTPGQQSIKAMLACFGHMAREEAPVGEGALMPRVRMEAPRRSLWRQVASVAAVAVLGIFIGSTLALRQDKGSSGDVQATVRIAPTTGDPIYGYINGQPVTDAHEAVRQSEEALRSMGMQMNKSAGYLSSFDGPMERVSAALTNMK